MSRKKAKAAATFMYKDKHEIEAEINARRIALHQTGEAAMAHIEKVLGAIIQSLEGEALESFNTKLAAIETITPEEKETVQIYGEIAADGEHVCGEVDETTGEVIKSKRQKWREEIAVLEEQLPQAPDAWASSERSERPAPEAENPESEG